MKHFSALNALQRIIAFSNLSDNEFKVSVTQAVNSSLTDSHLRFFSKEQHVYLNKLNNLIKRTSVESSEDDDNLSLTNCKYYKINEFIEAKFELTKSFSIFHINIHSIQLHFEELKLLLQLIDFKFDILAISESKLEKGVKPIIDICKAILLCG